MGNRSLLWTFLPPILAVFVVTLLLFAGFAGQTMRSFFLTHTGHQLEHLARTGAPRVGEPLARGDEAAVREACRRLGEDADVRITVVAADGRVLGDSADNPATMDNHGRRPEIVTAFTGATGTSTRYSRTLDHTRMYVAVPLLTDDSEVQAVIRTSVSLEAVDDLMQAVYARIGITMGVLMVLAGFVSWLVSRHISLTLRRLQRGTERIAEGDLTLRVTPGGTAEIAAVARAMNEMAEQLQARFTTIERQRNELEAVMTSMVEGVMAVDAEENIIGINPAAGRLFEFEPARAIGRSVQEVGRNPEVTALVQEIIAGAGPLERDVQIGTRHDVWLQVHATGLRGRGDERVGVLLVLNDISRLRRLETMRRDFVANVSHELKTPITSIKGFVETILAESPADGAEFERFLNIINRQADRLDSIITDLLALSRLEKDTDNGGIERHELVITQVLDRIVRDLASRRAEDAERIHFDCEADVRAPINSALLEQAVGNLLQNALKYSPENSLVELTCRVEGDEILISVRDSGPGIAAEHLPRLFERFYRVDKARSRRMGGTGLGLAIVKHIAQAHGGHVEVSSEVGKGSTFTIAIPREIPS